MEPEFPFTPEMIRQLQKEFERHNEKAEEHRRQAEAIGMILQGAQVAAPRIFRQGLDVSDGDTAPERLQVTMPQAIRGILEEAGRGMTKLGLRERLAEQYPDMKLGPDGRYFYRTCRRLEDNGTIRKRGKMLRLSQ